MGELSAPITQVLLARRMSSGGFCEYVAGPLRPDSTAWAILALRDALDAELLKSAQSALTRYQLQDGRVCLSPEDPEVFWPSPLAALCWRDAPDFVEQQKRAIEFLIRMSGIGWEQREDSSYGHDTQLIGWSWVFYTHSWVEPTALGILALRGAGLSGHPRVAEAVKLLLDRQLPNGGWNYGNTTVFKQQLHSNAESTGAALLALSGMVERRQVQRSLDYLQHEISGIRTPLSLGWGLLGLDAWELKPADAERRAGECFERQTAIGEYLTSQLALLALGVRGKDALLAG